MIKFHDPEEVFLSNKIPVIFQHSEGSVAAIYWWVQVGSADERPEESGFAHFVEHMLFKDASSKETGRASTGETARLIESLGGDVNAYTSFDQTVYHVTCAAQHWDRVLDAFGSMAKPQKFSKKDFDREKEVILEEIKKNQDSPERQLFQELFSTTFQKHPYGRPVIGFKKILEDASVSSVESFYRTHYVAARMGLVLVGPLLEKGKARKKLFLKKLESYFAAHKFKKNVPQSFSRPIEPQMKSHPQWKTKGFDIKTPSVSISFRVPDLVHEDLPALDLLSHILGMGELSRLYQRLFYQMSLTTDISGGLYVPKDPGMLFFQAELDSIEKINPAVEEIFKECKRIMEEGPTKEELARVLVYTESERLYATQTADGLAARLGFLKFSMGDLAYEEKYIACLRQVNAEKLKEIAKKYLTVTRMSGVILLPKEQANFSTKWIEKKANEILAPQAQESSSIEKWMIKSKKIQTTAVESFETNTGIKVLFYPRRCSHVFSVHASFLGGARLEKNQGHNTSYWGASHLMGMTWTKGTSQKNLKAIASLIEGHAASIDGFSGQNSVGLQMTGLARDWKVLSELFTEVLWDPQFPEGELDHMRRLAEDLVKSVEDHSMQLCSRLFLETLYESHPYGRSIYGSLESLKQITTKELSTLHRAWVKPKKLVLSVSGAIEYSQLESWIKNLESFILSSLNQKADQKVFEKKQGDPMVDFFSQDQKIESEPPLKASRWVEKSFGREQSHLLVGGLGTTLHSRDHAILRLFRTILGGQSGRLFIELREKRSLAYTVAPVSFEGLERGYIGTYIACAPEKKEEALLGIRSVIEKLAFQGPSLREMRRAREFFMGKRAMDLQSDSAMAAYFGFQSLYGLPLLSESEVLHQMASVTPKEIQKFTRTYLVEPYMVTSIVN